MAVLLNPGTSFWDTVLELTKAAQVKESDPLLWAIHLSCNLNSAGVSIPSPELADLLVSHICWANNVPTAWKLLEKALATKIVHPLLVIALLSNRVVPNRQLKPVAYRLFLELIKRNCLVLKPHIEGLHNQKVMNSIDSILGLSNMFCLQANEPGILLVVFLFSIVCQLVDASLDDEGLLELVPDKKSHWVTQPTEEMEVDVKMVEHQEKLRKSNTTMAIELIGQFLQSKVTSRILFLARQNMSSNWSSFKRRMELLAENSAALRNSKVVTPKALLKFISGSSESLSPEGQAKSLQEFHHVMSSGRLISSAYSFCNGVSRSVLWLPVDLLLEDAMDGSQVDATSAVEIVTGLIKALQAINGTTWHETLLGLWMAALRLVQREKDPIEGPIPRLDTRLSMLLTITTLVVADLIEEEGDIGPNDEMEINGSLNCIGKPNSGKRRRGLISSLQSLADYHSLLTPPSSVVSAANQAAAKAMMFVSGVNFGSVYFDCIDMTEMPNNCSGTMHHLIIEACIARNLLDTSAYFWPGYINGCISQLPHNLPIQASAWSSFMKGAPLTPMMTNALVSAPASSQG